MNKETTSTYPETKDDGIACTSMQSLEWNAKAGSVEMAKRFVLFCFVLFCLLFSESWF
jgi:hypothetical protein